MTALAGDHVLIKMDDAGGTLRTFETGDIVSVDLGQENDQYNVTDFGDQVNKVVNGQLRSQVSLRGYVTNTPNVGTHRVIQGAYAAGAQVTLEVQVGDNAAPTEGDPSYGGEFLVANYQTILASGGAVMFSASLVPAIGTAPAWSESESSGGEGEWTPESLTSLWSWHRSDTGVWQDTAGTSAADDTDNVARWDDQSGNGRHLLQGDSGKRPVLATNVLNGEPAIQLSTDDWLQASVSNAPSEDYSLFIVMKLTSLDDDEMFVDVGKYQYYSLTGMMVVGHYWSEGISAYWNGSLAETGSNWCLHSVIVDGNGSNATGSLYLNGTLKYSGSSSNQTQSVDNTLTVGGSRHGYTDWIVPNMQVAEIIILDAVATSQEIQQVNDYIEDRYGLTIA